MDPFLFLFRRTKVFLKYYHYEQLKVILDRYVYYAICIQKSKKKYTSIFNNFIYLKFCLF